MGFIKDFYLNFEQLLASLLTFDYSKVVFILIFFIVSLIIHLNIEKKSTKRYLRGLNIEIKRINAEANYKNKKRTIIKVYGFVFMFCSLMLIMIDNLAIFIPVITGVIVLSLFSLREQLNNIFLGIMFKSPFQTTIHEGLEFYFLNNPNNSFKIVKINLFKSILKSDKTGKLESIENKKLNTLPLVIKPLKQLDYISFSYIVDNNLNIKEYEERVKNFIKKQSKIDEFDFSLYRQIIFDLKEKYNSIPYLKPFYYIDLIQKDKDNIEIVVNLSIYDYNMENYPNDFFYLNPNREINTFDIMIN